MTRLTSRQVRVKWLVLFVVAVAIAAVSSVSLSPPPASADGGPHQGTGFGTNPDQCAGCHRIHTGQSSKLLKASSATICTSCHDGSGANTNVNDGVYLGGVGNGLRGGGFTNALMDTGLTGILASTAVSSSHTTDGTTATAWGAGAINGVTADYGLPVTLECSNCHDPHGNGQYRILRKKPNEGFGATNVIVADEVTPNYEIAYLTNNRRDTSYVPNNIGDWCAQCHTRYLSNSTADSGDAVFKFRHKSDSSVTGGAACLSCHVAHGTSASMGSWSGAVAWPNGAAGGGTGDSRLLIADNRGVCMACHSNIGQ